MSRFDVQAASALIASARVDATLTQTELARRSGVSQPNIAAIEAGRRRPSAALLERILAAADYRPSVPLEQHAARIRAAADSRGLTGLRVAGSVARGEDHFDSDIDLLVDVDVGPDTELVVLVAFASDVESITGFPVDVIDARRARDDDIGRRMLEQAIAV